MDGRQQRVFLYPPRGRDRAAGRGSPPWIKNSWRKIPPSAFPPRSISPRSRQIYNDANRGRRAPIECLDRIFTRGTGLVSSVCAVYMYTYDAWKRVNWSGREGGREKKVFSRDREESMGPDRRGRGRRRGEASVALLLDGDR